MTHHLCNECGKSYNNLTILAEVIIKDVVGSGMIYSETRLQMTLGC